MLLKSAAADLPECLGGESQRRVSTPSSRSASGAPAIDRRTVFNTPGRTELAWSQRGIGRWRCDAVPTVNPGEGPRVLSPGFTVKTTRAAQMVGSPRGSVAFVMFLGERRPLRWRRDSRV